MSNDVSIREGSLVTDEEIRLYICQECKQIIPIPSDGVPPYKFDYLLHKIEGDHGWRGHQFAIIAVTKAAWTNHDGSPNTQGQQIILKQIQDAVAGGETGLGSAFYDVKDQFHEDAMTCWKAHNRTLSCDEFKSDRKILMPDTGAIRRAEGLGKYKSDIHLCNFCPVASVVESKIRAAKDAKGLY